MRDPAEIQSQQTRRTKLSERFSGAWSGASPFGIILRPETLPPSGPPDACPFQAWEYRPRIMPDLVLQIAASAGVEEPMWCYIKGGRAQAGTPPEELMDRRQPVEHPAGFRDITGVHIVCPSLVATSVTQAMADQKVITLETGSEHLMGLQFDAGRKGKLFDFRPELPLVFHW